MEAAVFCDRISEVTSHHFCPILLARLLSLNPAHTQERVLHKSKDTNQDAGPFGVILEAGLTRSRIRFAVFKNFLYP